MSSDRTERGGIPFSLRLTLWYAAFFSIVGVGMFLFSYFLLARTTAEKNREVVQARVQEFHAWFEEGGLEVLKERFHEDLAGRHEAMFVRILGPGAKVVFLSMPKTLSDVDALPATMDLQRAVAWFETATNKESWLISSTTLREGFVLQVGMSVTQTRELLSHYRSLLWMVVLPIFILGILGGWWVTYYSLRPVRQLTRTMRQIIREGDMSERVPREARGGELAELVGLFNRLLEKNENLIQAMHNSLDTVAHDLKTPMTRLRISAEGALKSSGDSESAREALADCMEESDHVLSMLAVLMDTAEARTGSMRLEFEETSVSELVQGVVALYELVAEDRNVTIGTDLVEGLTLVADRRRLQQVLANLVDNAIKYSDPDGQIEIGTRGEGGCVVITVTDHGLGIPEEDVPKIWDRLYRGTRARSRRGLGIGLSFVKAIVEAHGGQVTVTSSPNRGSSFTVSLPGSTPRS